MFYGQPRKSAAESWENEPILDQYVEFTRVRSDQIGKHGKNEKAILETLRICAENGVLKEYLNEERQEVINIMRSLFDDEMILQNHINAEREEAAREAARKERESNFTAVAERLIKKGMRGLDIIDITGYDRNQVNAIAQRLNRTVAWEDARV